MDRTNWDAEQCETTVFKDKKHQGAGSQRVTLVILEGSSPMRL